MQFLYENRKLEEGVVEHLVKQVGPEGCGLPSGYESV